MPVKAGLKFVSRQPETGLGAVPIAPTTSLHRVVGAHEHQCAHRLRIVDDRVGEDYAFGRLREGPKCRNRTESHAEAQRTQRNQTLRTLRLCASFWSNRETSCGTTMFECIPARSFRQRDRPIPLSRIRLGRDASTRRARGSVLTHFRCPLRLSLDSIVHAADGMRQRGAGRSGMASGTQDVESTFLERLGDKFTSFYRRVSSAFVRGCSARPTSTPSASSATSAPRTSNRTPSRPARSWPRSTSSKRRCRP